MNMKMAYETPKMRAEIFQTNAYCEEACGTEKMVGHVELDLQGDNKMTLRDWWSGFTITIQGLFKFYDSSEVKSKNQVSGQDQFYYVCDTRSDIYLEWSAHQNAFVLYQEAGNDSGFFHEDGTKFEGYNTLQTNNGGGSTFQQVAHEIDQPTSYAYNSADGKLNVGYNTASSWYADHCIGKVDPERYENTFTIMNS